MRRQLRRALGTTQFDRCLWLAERAHESGGRLWLVGGAVRDAMLGRKVGDIDLALDIDVTRFVETIKRPFGEIRIRRHQRFGTATIEWPDSPSYDIVTTRGERYSAPAALPDVFVSTLEDDLGRRDFTIQAMAIQLEPKQPLRLIDPHGGREDLANKKIRALHSNSFRDDPTRAYRAVRYAARLGFSIETKTAGWMQQAVQKAAGAALSAHRRTTELRKILAEPTAPRAWRLLRKHRLLDWAPAAAADRASAIESRLWLRRWDQLRQVDGEISDVFPSFALAIALLGWSLQRPGRLVLASMLDLDRRERNLVTEGATNVANRLRRISAATRRSTVDEQLSALNSTERQLAFIVASAADARSILTWFRRERHQELSVNGRELIQKGVAPGPGVSRGLRAARRALLDRQVQDHDGQLRIALRSARSS
jgi:tRNA nucleotidyltransferase (CCA-adding enzyme)